MEKILKIFNWCAWVLVTWIIFLLLSYFIILLDKLIEWLYGLAILPVLITIIWFIIWILFIKLDSNQITNE